MTLIAKTYERKKTKPYLSPAHDDHYGRSLGVLCLDTANHVAQVRPQEEGNHEV